MKNIIKKKINKIIEKFGYEIINKNQKIVEMTNYDKQLIDLASKYSMTPKIRMFTLLQSLRYLKNKNIVGDYVECGVWKGGNLIIFKKFLDDENNENINNIKIYAYDTFSGMTQPDKNDFDLQNKKSASSFLKSNSKKSNLWGICNLSDVKKNLTEFIDIKNINFVEGPVEKTLDSENNLPKKISLLRLDTDWYSSTKKELEKLYERVLPGGVIIIDDYGHWNGSRKAVDEFFSKKFVWKHYVDYACRLIIKD